MKLPLIKAILFSLILCFASQGLFSCARAHCPGVASTGTIKPKQKRKSENGLYSAKMKREMARAQRLKAKRVEGKMLKYD